MVRRAGKKQLPHRFNFVASALYEKPHIVEDDMII